MSSLRRRLLQINAESPKNSAKASSPSLQRPSARRRRGNKLENCNSMASGNLLPPLGLNKKGESFEAFAFHMTLLFKIVKEFLEMWRN